jgi:hypothetical protein
MNTSNTIKIVVREGSAPWEHLEAFFCETGKWRRGYRFIDCFCFEEGHNSAHIGYYRQNTKPVTPEVANEFARKLQAYYDGIPGEPCKIVVRQRLS